MSTKTLDIPDAQLRKVMSALGKRNSEAKKRAARTNIAKANQANRKNPLDLICICGGGDSLEPGAHKTTCPRGRLLYQRTRAAQKAKVTA